MSPNVCLQPWSLGSGLPFWPAEISRPELPGTTGRPSPGTPVSSAWYLSGGSKGSSCRASPHASCCCLCRRGGLAPRTIIVATPDQVLCVSVCQSIWIFTSRAGDSFNFKSPANNVWSSECFHHWASTYTATCTGFVRARVVSQQSLPILCRNCSRRIVSLPVLILA